MHAVDDMTIFIRVVDRQGFSAAGRQLRMTTAVVSSRIAKLEQRLGVRLLNRTTRRVGPTEDGKIYYEHCRKVRAEIDAVEQTLAERRLHPAGALRVSVPVALGRRHIAPLIPLFLDAHPEIQVRLQVTDRVVDLVDEDVDVALRKGVLPSSAEIMRRIAPDLRVVCGAPDYFRRHGVPRVPEDLKEHNCLLLRFPGSKRYFWQFRDETGAVSNLPISGTMDSNSSDILVAWALQGQGLVMKSVWDLSDELESGALVTALQDHWPRGLSLQALMPARPQQPTKTRAFIDFLLKHFAKHPVTALTDPANLPRATAG